jgi:hypothetical protein
MNRSGFLEYFSLLTSGGVSFLTAWKELIFSLVESVPILEISAVIGIVLLFAYLMRLMAFMFANLSQYEKKRVNMLGLSL